MKQISMLDDNHHSYNQQWYNLREETGKLTDQEIRSLISKAWQRAKELLQQNPESLKSVAELLLKKEIIFKEDLEAILGKRPDDKTAPVKTMERTVPAALR